MVLKIFFFVLFFIIVVSINAQTCWKKSRTSDSVFVIQEKYDIANDTMCVIIIKENGLDCQTLMKLRKMKHEAQNKEIENLIAKGFRVEIYRKKEIF